MAMTWKEIEAAARSCESAVWNARNFIEPLRNELETTKQLLGELSTVIGPNSYSYGSSAKAWATRISENIKRIETLLGP